MPKDIEVSPINVCRIGRSSIAIGINLRHFRTGIARDDGAVEIEGGVATDPHTAPPLPGGIACDGGIRDGEGGMPMYLNHSPNLCGITYDSGVLDGNGTMSSRV
jgi:hypothetical protein